MEQETIEAKIKRLRSLRFIELRKEGLTLQDIADKFSEVAPPPSVG